jgi:hypothetical protein
MNLNEIFVECFCIYEWFCVYIGIFLVKLVIYVLSRERTPESRFKPVTYRRVRLPLNREQNRSCIVLVTIFLAF